VQSVFSVLFELRPTKERRIKKKMKQSTAVPPKKSFGREEWKSLLQKTTVADLVQSKPQRDLVALEPQMPLIEALQRLSAHQILSAPIVDSCKGTFLGFLDVLDIAVWVLNILRTSAPAMDLSSLTEIAERFYSIRVEKLMKDLPNEGDAHRSLAISEDAKLQQVVTLFQTKHPLSPHRIALSNPDHRLTNIVSQSDLIAFANAHRSCLGAMVHCTVEELHLYHTCITVRASASFADALAALSHNRVSGIGVIDEMGALVSNFSASDLRSIQPTVFANLCWSISDYLEKGTAQASQSSRNLRLVTCFCHSTLEEVLSHVVSHRVHRVYVVTETNKPVGVISLRDLLQLL